jgi:hypothetical protein
MRRIVSTACALAVAMAAQVASAETSDAPEPRAWYGWQFLVVDLGLIVATAATAASIGGDGSGAVVLIGAGGLVLSGPVVHSSNGRPDLAGRSLVLRPLLPAIGTAAGLLLASATVDEPGDDGYGALFSGFVGFTAGLAVAEIIDMASGWEDLRVVPTVMTARGATTAGLAFAF